MKYLYLIWSNLKRHKLRSVLTMLSILVAFLLFGYLGAIRTAFTAGIDVADLDRLIVRHKVSLVQLLPASYEARMERIEGVDQAVAQTWFGGYYQDPRNQFAQMPVKPEEFMDVFPEYLLTEGEIAQSFDQIFLISHVRVNPDLFNYRITIDQGRVVESDLPEPAEHEYTG